MKPAILASAILLAMPAAASAVIVNIDATHGFTYVPGGGSDPAPVPGEQIAFIGMPPTVSLAAGTYTITNATGKPGADPNLSAWCYNIYTQSWTWGFVIATSGGTVIDYESAGNGGSSQASVASQSAVQNFSSTLTLATPTVIAFTLRDYYVPDNAGGIALDIEPQSVVVPVPEPATWAMMLAGFGGLGAALRWRRTSLSAVTG
jgi:hypothetical protein